MAQQVLESIVKAAAEKVDAPAGVLLTLLEHRLAAEQLSHAYLPGAVPELRLERRDAENPDPAFEELPLAAPKVLEKHLGKSYQRRRDPRQH